MSARGCWREPGSQGTSAACTAVTLPRAGADVGVRPWSPRPGPGCEGPRPPSRVCPPWPGASGSRGGRDGRVWGQWCRGRRGRSGPSRLRAVLARAGGVRTPGSDSPSQLCLLPAVTAPCPPGALGNLALTWSSCLRAGPSAAPRGRGPAGRLGGSTRRVCQGCGSRASRSCLSARMRRGRPPGVAVEVGHSGGGSRLFGVSCLLCEGVPRGVSRPRESLAPAHVGV